MSQKRQRQPGAAANADLLKRLESEFYKKSKGHQSLLLCVGAEPWQKVDAAFFRKNPRRSFRLRAARPDEATHGTTHVIVKQIRPGVRERMFIRCTAPASVHFTDMELAAMWRRLDAVPVGHPVSNALAVADAASWGVMAGGAQ